MRKKKCNENMRWKKAELWNIIRVFSKKKSEKKNSLSFFSLHSNAIRNLTENLEINDGKISSGNFYANPF